MRSAVHGAVAALLLLAPAASADPAGKSTTDETIRAASGSGYVALERASGEDHGIRRHPSARAAADRDETRRSLAFFGQLTDPQIADEMSPARVDFLDAAGGEIKSSWRPQEAVGLQVFDQVVRNVNANRTSEIRDGSGKRAKLGFVVTTGDLADNQQLNETRWFKTVLDGGTVDPFSGKAISATNPCATDANTVAALNAAVAARQYTGVADYDDYPGVPAGRYNGFWDPDVAPGGGPYAAFPRYPGFLERAQQPFTAAGLDVPWYIARGNHDGLVQGNAPASVDLFRSIATGCLKVFPSATLDPAQFSGADEDEAFRRIGDPSFIQTLLAGAKTVPPDPDRRILSTTEYKDEIGGSHGYRHVEAAERKASDENATYYSFRPRKGVELISLDTVAEGGGSTGNLDHPQYQWLERKLKAAKQGRAARDRLRAPHARDDEQPPQGRGRGLLRADAQARLRRRPAPLLTDPPRDDRRGQRARAVPALPEPGRVRRRPHARQPDRPDQARSQRLLADQHRLARGHAAAEPPDRGHGQPRRHAVAVHDRAGPRGADRGARPGHRRGGLHRHAARERVAGAGLERPAGRARRPRAHAGPQHGAGATRPAQVTLSVR